MLADEGPQVQYPGNLIGSGMWHSKASHPFDL